MSRTRRTATAVINALLLTAAMAYAGLAQPRPAFDPVAWLLFAGLFLSTDALAIPIGIGYVNLAATAAMGAMLLMGPWAAAWIALTGAAVNVGARWAFPERVGEAPEPGGLVTLATIGLMNAVLLTLSLLGGALLYHAVGGQLPLVTFGQSMIGPFLLLVISFGVINYSIAAVYVMLPGNPAALRTFVRALPAVSGFELVPLLGVPLLPLVYTNLGPGMFLLFSLGLVGASLVIRQMAETGQRLQRRGRTRDGYRLGTGHNGIRRTRDEHRFEMRDGFRGTRDRRRLGTHHGFWRPRDERGLGLLGRLNES